MIHGGSDLILSDCFMETSKAYIGGAFNFEFAREIVLENLIIKNSSSEYNGGSLFVNAIMFMKIKDLIILNSSSHENGVIFIKTIEEKAFLDLENIFCENTVALEGSCIYFLSASSLSAKNVSIKSNGPIPLYFFWSYEVYISLQDVIISSTLKTDYLLYFSGVKVLLNNCQIVDNFASEDLFEFLQIKGYLNNLILLNNLGVNAFKSFASEIEFNNLTLLNAKNKRNYLEFIDGESSSFKMNNSYIGYLQSQRNFLLSFFNTFVNIYKGKFEHNNGRIIDIVSGGIWMDKCQFNNNTSFDSLANDLKFESSLENKTYDVVIINCSFSLYSGFSLFLNGYLCVQILDSVFENKDPNLYHGVYAIFSENIISMNINSSKFWNFTSSANYFITNSLQKSNLSQISISFTDYINNTASLGSSIYFYGFFNILLENCKFLFNYAFKNSSDASNHLQGIASSIFFKPYKIDSCKINLISNIFINNRAQFLSPSIFSQCPLGLDSTNIFINTTDLINFTNKAFSYPLHVAFINENNSIEIVSGNRFSLVLKIEDYFNQTLIFDSQSDFTLKNNLATKALSNQSSIIIQNGIALARNGIINFPNLIIRTLSSSHFIIDLSGTFHGLSNNDLNQLNDFDFSAQLNFYSRPCKIGEIIKTDFTCSKCPAGTYSLIDPMIHILSPQKCYECPLNCKCIGGSFITPLRGYYRKSNISIDVVPCLNSFVCLGNEDIQDSANESNHDNNIIHGKCLKGNEGALCFYCKQGFGKYDETDFCKECVSLDTDVRIRLAFYGNLILFYLLFNYYLAKKTNMDKEAYIGTIFKILLNHSQHINIILVNYKISFLWFEDFFKINDYFSFTNDSIIANDCIMESLYFNSQTHFIIREIIDSILPLVFSILACFVWITYNILVSFFKKSRNINITLGEIFAEFNIFIVFSIFIFYSLIIKACFVVFNCIPLDGSNGSTYLRESPAIECWSNYHLSYVFYFGVPGLFIWGIIFPFFLYHHLRKNSYFVMTFCENLPRHQKLMPSNPKSANSILSINYKKKNSKANLEENSKIRFPEISQIGSKTFKDFENVHKFPEKFQNLIEKSKTFSFFFKDYRQSFFFWECIIFLRKFLLTLCSSLSYTVSYEIRSIIMLSIIFIFFYFTNKYHPYKQNSANFLEKVSLIVCLISIFSSAIFDSNSNSGFQTFFSVVCILSNLVFVILVAGILFWFFYSRFKNTFEIWMRKLRGKLTQKKFPRSSTSRKTQLSFNKKINGLIY